MHIVVEAAPASAMDAIAAATLSAGKDLMALSGGALLERDDLFALAAANGATIYIPSRRDSRFGRRRGRGGGARGFRRDGHPQAARRSGGRARNREGGAST